MPEHPETSTEHLQELVREEFEREGGALLRRVALTSALFSVLAAVAALHTGETVNEALILKTEATRLEIRASDQWNYYQAKGLKAAVEGAARSAWLAAGKPVPKRLDEEQRRYKAQQADIRAHAEALEAQRDSKSRLADRLLTAHHGLANSVALFQVAIALSAIAALTRKTPLWYGSLAMGAAGIVAAVAALAG